MTPTLTQQIDTAERSLRKMFPAASRIDISFETEHQDGRERKSCWAVMVHFGMSGRESVYGEAAELIDAVTVAMMSGSQGVSKAGILAASDN